MKKRITVLCVAALVMFLAGCASYKVTGPEARKINRFLSRIQQNCGNQTIGGQTVTSLFAINSSDPIFQSWTTDLVTGKLSKKEYAKTINGSYPGTNNDRAISCITGQLPATAK